MTDAAPADTRVVLSFPLGEPEAMTLTGESVRLIKTLEDLDMASILKKADLRPCTRYEVVISVKMERTTSGSLCVSDTPVIEAVLRGSGAGRKLASLLQSEEHPDSKIHRAYRIYSFFEDGFQSVVEIPANV
jgi:hypothetical protein